MPSDYFAPLIATLFFVSATLAGIYIYCCFFRTSKEENDQNESTDKAHRDSNEERNVGILTSSNFYNHMYPFSMALPPKDLYGNVNVGFTSSPPNSPRVFEEKTAKVLLRHFEEKDAKEPVRDRPLFCRSTSHETKRVSSYCQLQVIQEVIEEEILDEEEAKVGE